MKLITVITRIIELSVATDHASVTWTNTPGSKLTQYPSQYYACVTLPKKRLSSPCFLVLFFVSKRGHWATGIVANGVLPMFTFRRA